MQKQTPLPGTLLVDKLRGMLPEKQTNIAVAECIRVNYGTLANALTHEKEGKPFTRRLMEKLEKAIQAMETGETEEKKVQIDMKNFYRDQLEFRIRMEAHIKVLMMEVASIQSPGDVSGRLTALAKTVREEAAQRRAAL